MWRKATIAVSEPSPRPGDYEAFFLKVDIEEKPTSNSQSARKRPSQFILSIVEGTSPAYRLRPPTGEINAVPVKPANVIINSL